MTHLQQPTHSQIPTSTLNRLRPDTQQVSDDVQGFTEQISRVVAECVAGMPTHVQRTAMDIVYGQLGRHANANINTVRTGNPTRTSNSNPNRYRGPNRAGASSHPPNTNTNTSPTPGQNPTPAPTTNEFSDNTGHDDPDGERLDLDRSTVCTTLRHDVILIPIGGVLGIDSGQSELGPALHHHRAGVRLPISH